MAQAKTELEFLREHFQTQIAAIVERMETLSERIEVVAQMSAENPEAGGATVGVTKVCKMLGVSLRSLNYWAAAGLLKPAWATPGRHVRYRVADVLKFMQTSTEMRDLDGERFDELVAQLKTNRGTIAATARAEEHRSAQETGGLDDVHKS